MTNDIKAVTYTVEHNKTNRNLDNKNLAHLLAMDLTAHSPRPALVTMYENGLKVGGTIYFNGVQDNNSKWGKM